MRAPFRLCVCPAVFQRYINYIFQSLIREGIVVLYLDDVMIIAENSEEASHRFKLVLEISSKFGLDIKWSKSQIFKNRIEFLGYEIENGHVWPSQAKTKDGMKFPRPINVQKAQSFLGLTGYFRKFIKDYAVLAKPLSDLLRKDVKFVFNEEQEAAFQRLKTAITTKPILFIFRYGTETELHTDASKHALGAILFQKDEADNNMHPIRYLSIETSPAEEK